MAQPGQSEGLLRFQRNPYVVGSNPTRPAISSTRVFLLKDTKLENFGSRIYELVIIEGIQDE